MQTSLTSSPDGLPDTAFRGKVDPVIETLFRRFQAAYGVQKLITAYDGMAGDPGAVMREVMGVWSAKLRPFHDAVIRRAMSDVLDAGNPWPPTLAEFTRACAEADERMNRDLRHRRSTLALPAPSDVADPSSPVVKQAQAEMRRFLGAHVVGGRSTIEKLRARKEARP